MNEHALSVKASYLRDISWKAKCECGWTSYSYHSPKAAQRAWATHYRKTLTVTPQEIETAKTGLLEIARNLSA